MMIWRPNTLLRFGTLNIHQISLSQRFHNFWTSNLKNYNCKVLRNQEHKDVSHLAEKIKPNPLRRGEQYIHHMQNNLQNIKNHLQRMSLTQTRIKQPKTWFLNTHVRTRREREEERVNDTWEKRKMREHSVTNPNLGYMYIRQCQITKLPLSLISINMWVPWIEHTKPKSQYMI